MLHEVAARPDIRPLTANPMLLTAACIIYHQGRRLPQDKYDLYDRIVDNVLATTVLAAVGPCSRPDWGPRAKCPRHRPAGYPLGAGGTMFSLTAGSSGGERVKPGTAHGNIAQRRQAAWWRRHGDMTPILVANNARRGQAPPWRSRHPAPAAAIRIARRRAARHARC